MNTSACEYANELCGSFDAANIQLDENVTSFPMIQLSAFPGIYSDRTALDFGEESRPQNSQLVPVQNQNQNQLKQGHLRSVKRLSTNEIGLPIQSHRTPDRLAQVIQVIVMGACLVALFIAS